MSIRNYIIETKRKEISFGINGEKSADEYIIAQNKSFVQKGIGVKYMDDLPRCPTTY